MRSWLPAVLVLCSARLASAHPDVGGREVPGLPLAGPVCDTAPQEVRAGHCRLFRKARIPGVGEVELWSDLRHPDHAEIGSYAVVVRGKPAWWTGWQPLADSGGCNTHACPGIAKVTARLLARRVGDAPGLVVDLSVVLQREDMEPPPVRWGGDATARVLLACVEGDCRESHWIPVVVLGDTSCDVTLDRRDATVTWACPVLRDLWIDAP